MRDSGEFEGKPGQLLLTYSPAGLKAGRLAVAGAGKRESFDAAALRKLVATAVRALRSKTARDLALWLDGALATPENLAAAAEGALTGDYEPDQLKTGEDKANRRAEALTLLVPEASEALKSAAARGAILGEAQNLARDMVNEPANRLTPQLLAARAQAMAAANGLECEVLDRDRMTQLGMGALLGVAQGSDEPPALIILSYEPAQASSADHLGLVGKGVTFDTGGVSIKPSDGMEKMKYDMAGGAAVIAAMQAIAQLKPSIRVTGFIPAVENHVSGKAQRPGDIVTTMAGKTVEVLNTDAEGRLILIDALTYAVRAGCTHLVDAATLTGAIVVALGHIHVGAFTNNEEFLARLQSAAKAEGERMWQLPMDEDYKDYLKSAFADLPNIGGRWGGAITAAYFIKEFVEDKPWVHLDIAGTAWLDDAKPHMAKGPTGVAVRTFVRLAETW
jgi:leucyl aminopeptidase